jgi:hypothetical protein
MQNASTSRISGTVSSIIFQGNCVRIGTQTQSDVIIWAEVRDDEVDGLAPGDTVTLGWADNAATLLREDSR